MENFLFFFISVARDGFDRGPQLEDRHWSTSCQGDGRERLELYCDGSCKGHGVSPGRTEAAQLLQATVMSSCFENSICTQAYVITRITTVNRAHEEAHSYAAVQLLVPSFQASTRYTLQYKIHSPIQDTLTKRISKTAPPVLSLRLSPLCFCNSHIHCHPFFYVFLLSWSSALRLSLCHITAFFFLSFSSLHLFLSHLQTLLSFLSCTPFHYLSFSFIHMTSSAFPFFSSRATIPTTFTSRTIHITDKLSMNDSNVPQFKFFLYKST